MWSIYINGVGVPVWLAALILITLTAGAVWLVHRRRARLQRQFSRALRGVNAVQGSIHPDAERLP